MTDVVRSLYISVQRYISVDFENRMHASLESRNSSAAIFESDDQQPRGTGKRKDDGRERENNYE